MSDNEPTYMQVNFYDHETIARVAVQVPDDFTTRDWAIGEPLVLKIVGVTRHGATEGIEIK